MAKPDGNWRAWSEVSRAPSTQTEKSSFSGDLRADSAFPFTPTKSNEVLRCSFASSTASDLPVSSALMAKNQTFKRQEADGNLAHSLGSLDFDMSGDTESSFSEEDFYESDESDANEKEHKWIELRTKERASAASQNKKTPVMRNKSPTQNDKVKLRARDLVKLISENQITHMNKDLLKDLYPSTPSPGSVSQKTVLRALARKNVVRKTGSSTRLMANDDLVSPYKECSPMRYSDRKEERRGRRKSRMRISEHNLMNIISQASSGASMTDQSIIVATVGAMDLLVEALSERRIRSRSI